MPISFTAAGPCTVSGATVQLTGAGTCTITTSQAGDATYNPAAGVAQSFTIAPAAPTLVVAAGGAITRHIGGTFNLSVGDLDTPAGNLTLTSTSSNPTLVPHENIAFGGSGAERTVAIGGEGADHFSGGNGQDTATDLTPSQGDTGDETTP